MNLTEIREIQRSLLEQKSEILNKSHEFRREQLDRPMMSDEGEIASSLVDENISIHLHEKDRRTLYQIERALGRIADGTYGQCESCHAEIALKRLLARPFSTLCISCKEEAEAPLFQ